MATNFAFDPEEVITAPVEEVVETPKAEPTE